MLDPAMFELMGGGKLLVACGARVITPVPGGGNNRLYRVEARNGNRYALKSYAGGSGDGGKRLEAEFRALMLCARYGFENVPEPLAIDAGESCALYEWIDGNPLQVTVDADIDAALAFVEALRDLAAAPEASVLADAKEACFLGLDLAAQIEQRLEALRAHAPASPELATYLDVEFAPAFRHVLVAAESGYREAGLDFSAAVGAAGETLSPSDFGFHNALRTGEGSLVFVDFEYFGWDDPVKLAADFLLHPGMTLSPELKRRFVSGMQRAFAAETSFGLRLRLLYPLFGLRWCLILLNEFLPEGWERRARAGAIDRSATQARQLAKAHAMLTRIVHGGGDFPHDA